MTGTPSFSKYKKYFNLKWVILVACNDKCKSYYITLNIPIELLHNYEFITEENLNIGGWLFLKQFQNNKTNFTYEIIIILVIPHIQVPETKGTPSQETQERGGR